MLTIKTIFVISQFLLSSAHQPEVSQRDDLDSKYQLPHQLSQPVIYHLSYEINQRATLKGHLDLEGLAESYLYKIILHAHPDFVEITNASWEFSNHTELQHLGAPEVNNAHETVTFQLQQKSTARRNWLKHQQSSQKMKFILHLDFTAKRTDKPNKYFGFYADPFKHHLKNTSKFSEIELTTQFQPNGARRAFPCFDEPAVKARFYLDKVTLIHEHADYLKVFFNMPGTKNSSSPGRAEWHFPEPTPVMSTYLFAITVANFPNSHTEVDKNSGLQVSLHHSKEPIPRTVDPKAETIPEFLKNNTEAVECFKRLQALDNTTETDLYEQCIQPYRPVRDKRMLQSHTDTNTAVDLTEPLKSATRFILDAFKYFENYFGLSAGVKKVDVVYVPHAAYGMEHWGLISMKKEHLSGIKMGYPEPTLSTATAKNLSVDMSAGFSLHELTLVHEAVHSWIGNRVTCDLWSNIWLNEGITMFYVKKYEMKILEKNLASFNTEKKRHMAMEIMKHSPVVSKKHEEDHDWHSPYKKAPYIIFMLEGVIGEANLLNISKTILNKYSFSTISTNQYIETVQELVNKRRIRGWDNKILDVDKLLYTWLYKAGYPTIEVSLDHCDVITLTQVATKYEEEPETGKIEDWFIPVFYTIQGSENKTNVAWIVPNQKNTRLHNLKNVNPHSVIWDPENRGWYEVKLVGKLKPKPSQFKAAEPPLTVLEKVH